MIDKEILKKIKMVPCEYPGGCTEKVAKIGPNSKYCPKHSEIMNGQTQQKASRVWYDFHQKKVSFFESRQELLETLRNKGMDSLDENLLARDVNNATRWAYLLPNKKVLMKGGEVEYEAFEKFTNPLLLEKERC